MADAVSGDGSDGGRRVDANASDATEADHTAPDSRLLGAVLAAALLASAMRLYDLGARTAHWDEARHGYAVLRYAATGTWEYRPILHGPLLAHANELLVGLLGPGDAVVRLVPALVGGLLPLSAWLFREHLRRSEVVALAGLLALNPALLYYSRFARTDVLVATFALVAVGLAVRLADTRDPRYLYAASVAFALAVASKENALVYAACWVGSGALLVDHRLFRKRWSLVGSGDRRVAVPDWLRSRIDGPVVLFAVLNPVVLWLVDGTTLLVAIVLLLVAVRCALWTLPEDGEGAAVVIGVGAAAFALLLFVGEAVLATYAVAWVVAAAYVLGVLLRGSAAGRTLHLWRAPALLAGVLFMLVVTVAYVPRGATLDALWTTPAVLPGLVEAALFDSWDAASDLWFGAAQDQGILDYGPFFLRALVAGAAVTCLFGLVGFLADRYGDGGPRDVVAFSAYWGFASVALYPVVMYGKGPWHAVHVAVPLAVPAAVGLSLAWRWGREAVADRRVVSASLAVLVLTGATGAAAGAAVQTSYLGPTSPDNVLVQTGQPGTDLRPAVAHAEAAAAGNAEGPDVVYYGAFFAMDDESAADALPVEDEWGWRDDEWTTVADNENWYHRLPLPWYFEQAGMESTSARNVSELSHALASNPPVVVTRATHADRVSTYLGGGYERYRVNVTAGGTPTVLFVASKTDDRESKR
ncbi:flippase activity-associated protein Agl23 [Haloarchaeobius sp. HRN-SO-5]|uniref:flippase activity-associated protein Agl23 n=1 Tax=Haloarchaeobius sp. HRN-SO-5 TaxID=3446118 RepID=UPI003EBE1202